MKKIMLIVAAAINILASSYTVEESSSKIKFEANKFMFVGVSGEFEKFSGKVVLDDELNLESLSGKIKIDSINTNDAKRDTHLKEDDYFYADKFPSIDVKSVKMKGNVIEVATTIKGTTKVLDFNIDRVKVEGSRLVLELSSVVDRQDFMLNGSMSSVISDAVNVKVELIAYKSEMH
ncbi:MAG: polyisoprenoid-binding protein [Sulfurimonas sp.]|nr:polyisoprenoid-binding protein [Sulfurimonas sp.]